MTCGKSVVRSLLFALAATAILGLVYLNMSVLVSTHVSSSPPEWEEHKRRSFQNFATHSTILKSINSRKSHGGSSSSSQVESYLNQLRLKTASGEMKKHVATAPEKRNAQELQASDGRDQDLKDEKLDDRGDQVRKEAETEKSAIQDEVKEQDEADDGDGRNDTETEETKDDNTNGDNGKEQKLDPKSASCPAFAKNSEQWLTGRRYGNVDDPAMGHPDFIRNMITELPTALQRTGGTRYLIGQSLCHEQSRLLNDDKQSLSTNNTFAVRMWAVRLAYMAIHYHQHRLAIPEAKARLQQSDACEKDLADFGIGRFDYECPDAKYLVIILGGFGLGVNIRVIAVSAIMLGLETNRVVLLMNHATYKNNPTCNGVTPNCKWDLVSCPRKDMQCIFFPPSPCVLTPDDLINAYVLTSKEGKDLAARTVPFQPKGHENEKVWIVPSTMMSFLKLASHGNPQRAMKRLDDYIHMFLSHVRADDPCLPILKAAAKEVQVEDSSRTGYHYLAATNKIRHAAVFYVIRPNIQAKAQLDLMVKDVVPADMDIQSVIGLPIRASDKCKRESDCLSFEQHIEVTTNVWGKHLNVTSERIDHPTILFTSESKAMAKEQLAFAENTARQAKYKYKFDFLSNSRDVAPDSGFIKHIRRLGGNVTANDALLGALSSLKLQLLPRVSIGNCCSNFHILLFDLLMEGCGASPENTLMCLNEYEDRALRTCCGWHNECKERKKQHIAKLQNTSLLI